MKSLNFFSKKNDEDLCPHHDVLECPYNKRSECPDIKKNCHLPEDEENQSPSKNYREILLFIISVLVIVMSISLKESQKISCLWGNVLLEILLSVGVSLFAGVVLAWLINLPQNLEDFTQIVTTSLSSFKYLSSLSKDQLVSLRNRVTYELHSKKVPYMPQGLLKLDKKICDLLENPYYKTYREIIQCHNKDKYENAAFNKDGEVHWSQELKDTIVYCKDVIQEYTIKNPFDKQHPIKANIGISNHIFLPSGCEVKEIFEIESYQLSIDNQPFVDIMPLLGVVYNQHTTSSSNVDPDTITYNMGLFLSTKEGKTLTLDYLKNIRNDSSEISYTSMKQNIKGKVDLLVQFSDSVSVKFKYKQVIPEADNHFTKRLKYSTKSYRLDYFCDDNDIQLFGQLFGTLIDQSQISINLSKDGKHISVESFEWLLPKSGAFVAMGSK